MVCPARVMQKRAIALAILALTTAAGAWEYYIFDLPSGCAEAAWRDALAERLGGQTEVPIEGGCVDVLTDAWAIELDWPHKWHEGLGQALHYAEMTGRQGVLALISYAQGPDQLHERSRQRLEMVERLCRKHGVQLIVLFPSRGEEIKGGAGGSRAPSEGRGQYWLNSRTGVRHRPGCIYYRNTRHGYPCGPNEGRPCKICGGWAPDAGGGRTMEKRSE